MLRNESLTSVLMSAAFNLYRKSLKHVDKTQSNTTKTTDRCIIESTIDLTIADCRAGFVRGREFDLTPKKTADPDEVQQSDKS